MARTLTPHQLTAMRSLDPGDKHVPPGLYRGQTIRSLEKHRLVGRDEDGKPVLTETGKRLIRKYVEDSGNGPEGLKARFRFLR
jgi:hypothetical protein